MGAYLSTPRTEKDSIDETTDDMVCGASSMQGWRINQEDAHNCELNFDKDASFFAVYDGHGGPEIAQYCSKYLPAFLKATEAYSRGDFEQALKDAFLGFDSKLLQSGVIEELKVLAGEKYGYGDDDEDEEDSDEDLSELRNEGRMPIQDVLSKYSDMMMKKTISRLAGEEPVPDAPRSSAQTGKPQSPCLRGKKQTVTSGGGGGGGEGTENGSEKPSGSTGGEEAVSSSSAEGASSSAATADEKSSAVTVSKPMESPDSSSVDTNQVGNSEASVVAAESSAAEGGSTSSSSKANDVSSSSSNNAVSQEAGGSSAATEGPSSAGGSSSSTTNGESSSSGISSTNVERAAKRVAMQISGAVPDSGDSDEEDEVDVTYDENNSTDDTEDDDDDGEEDEEEDTSEDEEEDCDDDYGFINNMVEEPGKDSGCTAVVALRHGRHLYVANAGDSRCVLSRSGEVIEMSFDHKPEDTEEYQRIVKAGGRVTMDGRVNGGLNLSRAIGDHAYKMNVDLPPAEQMISALPDIKKIELTDADEFMVLACDGIWNFMSSEAVVNFVKARLDKVDGKLSQICEELFHECLAKDTSGDGTGCDNMTAIIVRFNWTHKETKESEAAPILEVGLKRAASSSPLPVPEISETEADGGIKAKRAKTDVEEAQAPTTTST